MTAPDKSWTLLPEWAPQSGVQLTWPHNGTDWQPYIEEITEVFIMLAREIARREKLLIVAQDTEEVKRRLTPHLTGEEMANIVFHQCQTNDTWARDHAPLTLTRTNTSRGLKIENKMLDFRFNGWGEKFPAEADNAITVSLYKQWKLNGELVDEQDFILEGGAIESDGEGTIFTTSACLLAPHRNQPMTRGQIEERLLESLSAKRIVWLDHGQLIGDDTDGHIDTLVRIAPGNTLLVTTCDNPADPHYDSLRALEEQCASLTTLDGRPYKILRLPLPEPVLYENERLPATYANYLVINGAVIVPTYQQPELDAEAVDIIQEAFPDRDIIAIDATIIVRQHGSIHCLTMQYPQGVL